MRATTSSHVEHAIVIWEPINGRPTRVFGASSWDVRAGRLSRPMGRMTELRDEKALRRWVKKYPDVSQADIARGLAALPNIKGEPRARRENL